MPSLNQQQHQIVEQLHLLRPGQGMNVVARAGTGKTYTVINGVVREIVASGMGSVVVMAYNKAAANEFDHRLRVLADEEHDERYINQSVVRTGTVHSLGFAALRRAHRTRVEGRKLWFLVDDMIDEARESEKGFIRGHGARIRNLVSLGKQAAAGIRWGVEEKDKWSELCDHYDVESDDEGGLIDYAVKLLKRSNEQVDRIIDFDDMIYVPLLENLELDRFDWVLIDEAQDTNVTRRMLASGMVKEGGHLVAVGDPKQAIYGFTGADSDAMELIAQQFGSVEMPLTVTYRCPKAVVRVANVLVPDLVAHEQNSEGVVRSVEQLSPGADGRMYQWFEAEESLGPNDVVLCRNTKPLVETAYSMIRGGLGCMVEGRDIGEGLVQLAQHWKNIKSLGVLVDKVREYQESEVEKALNKKQQAKAQAIEDKCQTLCLIAEKLISDGKLDVLDLVQFVRGLFGDTPEGEKPKVLTLSTVHKSKGREWDRVYVLGRSELMPSKYAKQPWQLEQERNLEYVAVTRAKRELVDVYGVSGLSSLSGKGEAN